jgi:hypothetical protein
MRHTATHVTLLVALAPPLGAQAPAPRRVAAQAVGMASRQTPAFAGRAATEGYLTQPVVMAHGAWWRERVRLTGTLNLEGLTLRRGQLNAGIYGEGFVDRRHPHTLVHEAVVAVVGRPLAAAPALRASLAAGKGFVAFGSDDPMMRPFAGFPVNHHLAQLLERLVATAGVRVGGARGAPGAMLEASTFGADEPQGPWAWPRLRRFGDAWAVRGTVHPLRGARAPGDHAGTGRTPRMPPRRRSS